MKTRRILIKNKFGNTVLNFIYFSFIDCFPCDDGVGVTVSRFSLRGKLWI